MSVSTQPGQIALTCTLSRRELGGERADEPEQPRLRGAVARVVRHGDPRQDRRDDDEMTCAGARREVCERGAAAVVGAVQVRQRRGRRSDRSVAVLVRPAEPAAGDERVDRPERLGGGRERLLDLAAIADVARDDVRAAARAWRERSARGAPGRVRAGSGRRRRARGAARSRGRCPVPAPVTTTCFPVMSLQTFAICGKVALGTLDRRHLPSIDFCLRRARGVSRTKPHREAVRGSGESAGAVDENVPGSAKCWTHPL